MEELKMVKAKINQLVLDASALQEQFALIETELDRLSCKAFKTNTENVSDNKLKEVKYVDRFTNIEEQDELISHVYGAVLCLDRSEGEDRVLWMKELKSRITQLLKFKFIMSCFEVV